LPGSLFTPAYYSAGAARRDRRRISAAELNSVRAQIAFIGVGAVVVFASADNRLLIARGPADHPMPKSCYADVHCRGCLPLLAQSVGAIQTILPVEAQLQSLLHSAETGEPLDETHVANLRPN